MDLDKGQPGYQFFSWWRLVPVRHTNFPRNPRGFPRYNFRNPRGNLVFVVETDPRPTPYNSGIPGDSWVAYWLGAAVSAYAKGLSKDEIKSLGRWKSDAVDVYINELPPATLASNLTALNSRLLSVSGPSSPSSRPLPSRSLPPSPLRPPFTSASRSLPSTPARRLARRD